MLSQRYRWFFLHFNNVFLKLIERHVLHPYFIQIMIFILELLDGLRPGSPKPGHIERISSPRARNLDDDPVITQRFLKINVRHITDGQGVVGGVLLVTPNAVMFDPNVSDSLVIEHGPESYGVIAPMELVVNAAIFHDIAHMRVGGGDNSNQTEKPEVYYPKIAFNRCENTHSPGKDSLLVKVCKLLTHLCL